MKNIVNNTMALLMRIISLFYPYSLNLRIRNIFNVLYTLWIRNSLGKFGERSRIYSPCSLQGGGSKRIAIGNNTIIQSHCVLGCWEEYGNQSFVPSIIIGDYCNIGEYSHITACDKITIGNGLLTGRFVYIGDNSHGGLSDSESKVPPINRKLQSKGEILIGNNVWIGDKATILGGITLGDNVIIGANSVVTHDIPSNSMAAGSPAKVIKQLHPVLT